MALLRREGQACQHPPGAERYHQDVRPRRPGQRFREDCYGLHRLPASRRQGIPARRSGSQVRRTRTPSSARSRPANTPDRRTAGFVILSNGNLHYFWDLERGNSYVITSFPTSESVSGYQKVAPDPRRLIDERVGDDYIVLTQRPNYASEAAWKNEDERPGFIQTNKLRFLRDYQLGAIRALQRVVKEGGDRFLFEMATGTGKTLTAAAVIKLFLRSGNARRALFLVDRLELEEQARKVFTALLSADFQTVIYKENRDDWRRAEIVVTTVQSLLFNNK